MKGVSVFFAVFIIVLVISFGYSGIPPGQQIYDVIGGTDSNYLILGLSVATLVPAIFNGVVFGAIIWAIYSLSTPSKQKKEEVRDQTKQRQILTVVSDQENLMSIPIRSLEGIGTIFAEKLEALDIKTTGDLLEAGKTSQKRATMAKKSGISTKLILEWMNLADLIRIKGISEEYSTLLEEAGVDTVPELARRNQENLYNKLREVNEEKKLVKRLPSVRMTAEWIDQAKKLPRMVEY